MTAKKYYKSTSYNTPPGADQQRCGGAAGVSVPADEKRRLVVAAAYFRAARHRPVGAEGCRSNDVYAAAMELEAVLRRHNGTDDAGSPDGRP